MTRRIIYLKKHVVENLRHSWTVEELAQIANISKSQLAKLFQTELEISPAQYIRNLRLEKACELLETTFLRIKEIMFAVGINDQSHFVRDFKKIYDSTPTEYRNLHQKNFKADQDIRQ